MKYTVEIKRTPLKVLDKLEDKPRRSVLSVIDSFATNPRPYGYKKLEGGAGEFRFPVGNYRLIYDINDAENLVTILEVRKRNEQNYK